MARKLYNFIWVALEEQEQTFVGALQIGFTITTLKKTTPGVILYPALLTPLVHQSKQDTFLELLIATAKTLTPDMVNRQLKISPGLRSTKHFDPSPLFGGAGDNIVVEEVDADLDELLESHTKFAGILHSSVVKALEGRGITKVWKVKVHASALRDAAAAPEQAWSTSAAKFIEYTTNAAEPKIRRFVRQAVVGKETHDELIRAMLRVRFGDDKQTGENPIPGMCRYAFKFRGKAVDLGKANPQEPIQSYHPVLVLSDGDEFSHANLGHVSDIHMNSRWQLLGKSTARVIEYGDGQHEDEVPRIGNLLSETNLSFHDVLHGLCASEAHAIIIGGDLIDHIRNSFNAATIVHKTNSVQQIWDTMDLDNYTRKTYPAGIDLIAFYTLVLDALRAHQKPFFAISGNHDCYEDAFGISPRVLTNRANGGIPADLNLTFYEALLAFGPTAGMLINLSSSFDAGWFEWFHLVLTPFNDHWTRLPKQSLVGLGWGNNEDIIKPSGEQGAGHLPRSEDGISKSQLALLQKAVGERSKRRVILTSHFTFLSYNEQVPMFPGGAVGSPGTFNSDVTNMMGFDKFSRFEMGTFEKNRQALQGMLGGRQIQCVLTGHSHRRGLHLLGTPVGTTIPARLYDTDPRRGLSLSPLPQGESSAEPAIIVSDSAGPYPRYNRNDEFREWGSDRPGATLVRVDPASGDITNVRTIQAGSRPLPRAVVAIDYMDLDKQLIFDNNAMIVKVTSPAQDAGVGLIPGKSVYTLLPCLREELRETRKIYLRRLIFSAQKQLDGVRQWIRIEVNCSSSEACPIPFAQTDDFRWWLKYIGEPTRFASMQFGCHDQVLAKQYDWNSFWNFEIEAAPKYLTIPLGNNKFDLGISYVLTRPMRKLAAKLPNQTWREVPPYDWRTANDPKYAR